MNKRKIVHKSDFLKSACKQSSPSLPNFERHMSFSEGVQALITCTPQIVTLSSVYSGIDTLHLSLFADLSNSNILAEIEKARDVAREFEQDHIPFVYFSPQWNVHRSGRRFFTYHLSMADIHIYFNKRSVHGNFPTCIIEIGSLSSHHPGIFKTYNQILDWFLFCNITVKKHHITRVDLSTDFINLNLSELDLNNGEKWISRARHFSTHHTDWNLSGISIGKGNIMCRIYEKRTELNIKRATAKTDFFNRQWGLISDDKKTPVVRVEFQLRREILKELKTDDLERIETLDDLKKSLNGIWGYCSKCWLRHCEKAVDRSNNNHKQSKLSGFWELVQLVNFNQDNRNLWRHREKKDYINVEALIDQGVGCLVAAMGATIDSMEDFKQVASMASSEVWRKIQFRFKFHEAEIFEKIQIAFNRNTLNPIAS